MIFPDSFLVPEEYKSWRVGREAPMISSAVLTVQYSLFLSCFVATADHTVMDRTESITVVWNWHNSENYILFLFEDRVNVGFPLQVMRSS